MFRAGGSSLRIKEGWVGAKECQLGWRWTIGEWFVRPTLLVYLGLGLSWEDGGRRPWPAVPPVQVDSGGGFCGTNVFSLLGSDFGFLYFDYYCFSLQNNLWKDKFACTLAT